MTAPLAGLRVIEFAGLGPTPFTAMMLANMGAEVLRIERSWPPDTSLGDPERDFLRGGRPAIVLDLKTQQGRDYARDLVRQADVLIEGYRPGVMERLDLGPDRLNAENSRLIYARMTGWGQTGPLSLTAGHDINYLALTGALHMMGDPDRPPAPPINLVGDYGGGAMFLLSGILAALLSRQGTGLGQVVDAAMTDGVSMLMTQMFAWSAMGSWHADRGSNLLDGSAYFYRCYETADGKFIAVGALEAKFHDELLRGLGLDPVDFPDRLTSGVWAERSAIIGAIFKSASRDEWVRRLAAFDACVTPVLTMAEAVDHPSNTARGAHLTGVSGPQPAFAPRLMRTPATVRAVPKTPLADGIERLRDWGLNTSFFNTQADAKNLTRASAKP